MPRDLRTYLWEVERAGHNILSFKQGKQFADYRDDLLLQAGIERMFEIIGEALTQITQHFPESIARVDGYKNFIGFRNVLIHQYSSVDQSIVWEATATPLARLLEQVRTWREELDPGGSAIR